MSPLGLFLALMLACVKEEVKEQRLGWSGDGGFSLGVGQFTRQQHDLPSELGSLHA